MTKQISDPYAVLGIHRDAGEPQVRDAYRRLAKRHHPDLHPDSPTSERMRQVNEAWYVLSDPARRARYDAAHPRVVRPWPPAWAPAATAGGAEAQSANWGASAWTPRPGHEPRPRVDHSGASGPPWVALLAVLAVGWLVIGGIVGGFPLPAALGFLAVVAVSSVISRFD